MTTPKPLAEELKRIAEEQPMTPHERAERMVAERLGFTIVRKDNSVKMLERGTFEYCTATYEAADNIEKAYDLAVRLQTELPEREGK